MLPVINPSAERDQHIYSDIQSIMQSQRPHQFVSNPLLRISVVGTPRFDMSVIPQRTLLQIEHSKCCIARPEVLKPNMCKDLSHLENDFACLKQLFKVRILGAVLHMKLR